MTRLGLSLLVVMGFAGSPATAFAARAIPLHGAAKLALIDDSDSDNLSAPVGSPGNDQSNHLPSKWSVQHCAGAWALSGKNSRWGIWTYTGGDNRRCERSAVASNGIEITYIDRFNYWENDLGDDETAAQQCGRIANDHYRGRPRPSGQIVRELLAPLGGCR